MHFLSRLFELTADVHLEEKFKKASFLVNHLFQVGSCSSMASVYSYF